MFPSQGLLIPDSPVILPGLSVLLINCSSLVPSKPGSILFFLVFRPIIPWSSPRLSWYYFLAALALDLHQSFACIHWTVIGINFITLSNGILQLRPIQSLECRLTISVPENFKRHEIMKIIGIFLHRALRQGEADNKMSQAFESKREPIYELSIDSKYGYFSILK